MKSVPTGVALNSIDALLTLVGCWIDVSIALLTPN